MKNMAGRKYHGMMMQANHIYYTRKTANLFSAKIFTVIRENVNLKVIF